MRVRLIHDFIAFLASLAVGVLFSFAHPLAVSVGVFALSYALWLIVTSGLIAVEHRYSLDPRVARSSIGGLLLFISVAITATSMGLDARLTLLVLIALAALIAIYVYALSKRVGGSA